MNISPISHRSSYVPVETSSDRPFTSGPSALSGEDRFNDLVFHSSTNTPFTDAYTNTIRDPQTPIADRVTLGLMIPIMVPITAILDVIFFPIIKVGHFIDWVKNKLS